MRSYLDAVDVAKQRRREPLQVRVFEEALGDCLFEGDGCHAEFVSRIRVEVWFQEPGGGSFEDVGVVESVTFVDGEV
jgi:hypothetical protein